jgi:hypothetical protein
MLAMPFINFFGAIVAYQRNQEAVPSTYGTPLICGSAPLSEREAGGKEGQPGRNQR